MPRLLPFDPADLPLRALRWRKAPLLMGSLHLQRHDGKPTVIEQQMLTASVKPYIVIAGSDVVGTYDDVDARFVQHPWPWLMEIKGSWLSSLTRPAGCTGDQVSCRGQ